MENNLNSIIKKICDYKFINNINFTRQTYDSKNILVFFLQWDYIMTNRVI